VAERTEISFHRARISAGTRLNGIYEIDSLIGVGGMGEIYKGHAIQTGDLVAIKLMLPELAENEAALALFRKEASALHNLQHDAIIRYYVSTVEPQLQRPYLAMEFVDGRSLSEILKDDGPLPFEAVRALMLRVTAGLMAAHQRGIIHRDVSPDNIIVPGGDVSRSKIIDFGIARSTLLSEGTVIGSGFAGKQNYVSPEQLGLFGGEVTAKSDIYSLGLVLVQTLTGQALDMGGTQVQIVEKRRKVPDLGMIDMRIRPLLERMLQPDPINRPESMAAVAAWPLGSAAGAAEIGRPGAARYDTGPQTKRPGRWRYAAAAVLLIAIIAGGAGYYYYFFAPSTQIAQAPVLPPPLSPKTAPPLSPTPSPPLSPTAAPPTSPRPTQVPSSPPKPPAGDIASLPPKPSPAPSSSTPPASSSTPDRIRRYVEQYDGGECFFITPVAIGATNTTIEGFGASLQPFQKLDDAFKREIGFSPDIGVRQVTQQQCAAITFLARLRDGAARAPRIDIDKTRVRSGETVTGTIERFGNRNVELIAVQPNGHILSRPLRDGIDAKNFNLSLSLDQNFKQDSVPILLLAIVSPRKLAALDADKLTRTAAELFPAVLAEAAATKQPISVAARYYRVER
jgi:serine/threonine protein kinase